MLDDLNITPMFMPDGERVWALYRDGRINRPISLLTEREAARLFQCYQEARDAVPSPDIPKPLKPVPGQPGDVYLNNEH